MSPEDKPSTITCRGCGQVAAIVSDIKDEFGNRRRFGFIRHGKRDDGTAVLACCKCQQLQACEIAG